MNILGTAGQSGSEIPPDDATRSLTVAGPDDPDARHVSVVGNTYTILVSGAQTAGRYSLIDMIVPAGNGPPPHRHDFEEMFTLLKGELDFTFRGETRTVQAGSTVNVPANAPHAFKNNSRKTAHMLCMCTPAGQEEFFLTIGIPLASRSDGAPEPSAAEKAEKGKLMQQLLPLYRTEMVKV